jgi:hypothetical protein
VVVEVGQSIPQIVETVYDKLLDSFGLSGGSDPTSWVGCGLGWQREWLCITSACGSTISSAVLAWLSPTCWDGELNSHQAYKDSEDQ